MAKQREITAAALAALIDVSLARVGQLAKEGVITRLPSGKYSEAAVTEYVRWLRATAERKNSDWAILLEAEKYREKKRQNDLAEKLVAPIEVLEKVVERGVAGMVPILESLPLVMKRHWPEITGDQIRLVKQSVAECRNVLADMEITIDD